MASIRPSIAAQNDDDAHETEDESVPLRALGSMATGALHELPL
jgi:hypothetical protein